jgi:hypothetical protein
MREKIEEHNLQLVVIDTATTWLAEDVNMNAANEVMAWLNPLKEIAQETQCSIVLIRHRRKGQVGDNKMNAGLGSIGWSAAVRSELAAWTNKKGMRLLEKIKGNVGAQPPTFVYDIVTHPTIVTVHGQLVWIGVADAADVETRPSGKSVNKTPKGATKAKDFLIQFLSQGPRLSRDVFEAAKAAGVPEGTLKRIKGGIVESTQVSGEWWWALSPNAATAIGTDGEEYLVC